MSNHTLLERMNVAVAALRSGSAAPKVEIATIETIANAFEGMPYELISEFRSLISDLDLAYDNVGEGFEGDTVGALNALDQWIARVPIDV